MDTPTLVGTGFFILAAVVWVVCAVYCYQMAPKFGRNPITWAILGIIFGPIALMILYVLPKGHRAASPTSGGSPGHTAAGSSHKATQAELYEVPHKKKHH